GSATVDAGCGLAKALGFRLYDRRGRSIPDGGGGLSRLARIRHDTADPRLSTTSFIALADVQNPLLGPNGAAPVFAPQKGANAVEVLRLERNLLHWHRIIQRTWGLDVASANGAGAAGGLGAGCLAFLGAQLIPGAQWVAEQIGLAKAIGWADLVLTGEGRLDRQTLAGKGPALVARLARVHRKPVIAVAGAVADRTRLRSLGLTRCLAITPPGMALSEAFAQAETNLEKTAAALMMAFRR
ncbi:MAG: glycerate kinase, partial [Lentisphaerae bacterium]|nr:glycerate kinase [Lentisphaerota bacterium]